jgi:hypothetical protein
MRSLLPLLREFFSQHPEALSSGPESLSKLLYRLHYLDYLPAVFEVEEALQALHLDGVVAA